MHKDKGDTKDGGDIYSPGTTETGVQHLEGTFDRNGGPNTMGNWGL